MYCLQFIVPSENGYAGQTVLLQLNFGMYPLLTYCRIACHLEEHPIQLVDMMTAIELSMGCQEHTKFRKAEMPAGAYPDRFTRLT